MTLTAKDALSIKAASLARSQPGEWQDFIKELRQYKAERDDQLVNASPDGLAKAQGRSQECAALLKILEDAVKTADSLSQRRGT